MQCMLLKKHDWGTVMCFVSELCRVARVPVSCTVQYCIVTPQQWDWLPRGDFHPACRVGDVPGQRGQLHQPRASAPAHPPAGPGRAPLCQRGGGDAQERPQPTQHW